MVPSSTEPAALERLHAAIAVCRDRGDPVALAAALNDLAGGLFAADQVDEALSVCDQSVDVAGQGLAEGREPARFVLVSALINRAGGWLRRGDLLRAADGLAEAVAVFRQGGEGGVPFLGAMVEALHRGALAFSEIGLWDQAVRMRRLTLDLFGESPPSAAMQILVLTLIQSSTVALAGGEIEPALAQAREAADLARALNQAEPEPYRLLLAQALGALSGCLHASGESGAGLEAALEAVDLLHGLVPHDPLSAVPTLVLTLESMAAILSALGLDEQAGTVEAQLATLRDCLDRLPSA